MPSAVPWLLFCLVTVTRTPLRHDDDEMRHVIVVIRITIKCMVGIRS